LFFVNFTRNLPACPASAYETFYPEGVTAQSCVLGRYLSFTRKNQTAQCQADPNVLAKYTYTVCNCTRAD